MSTIGATIEKICKILFWLLFVSIIVSLLFGVKPDQILDPTERIEVKQSITLSGVYHSNSGNLTDMEFSFDGKPDMSIDVKGKKYHCRHVVIRYSVGTLRCSVINESNQQKTENVSLEQDLQPVKNR